MRRILLFCGGILLYLAVGTILWNGPDLFSFADSWHSALLTRMVGLAIIIEGVIAAFGAALCIGRAVVPLVPAPMRSGPAVPGPGPATVGGGPVLPLCGILFLLSAIGPFGQASQDTETLEVMDSMPGQFGSDLVDDFRRYQFAERIFGVLWLVVGGALLATPLLLNPRVWKLGWRMNGVGCAITFAGFLLSGMGALVFYSTALAMEGASKDLTLAGYIGVLAGSILAVVGSIIAVAGRSIA